METKQLEQTFLELFRDSQGHSASAQARSRLQISDSAFTYGEIQPDTFSLILNLAHPKPGEIFYDLGSGAGKAVMWAAIAYPFKKSIGVELLDELLAVSRGVLQQYRKNFPETTHQDKQNQHIDFIQADFCTLDFSEADIVFAHSTCFSNENMATLINNFTRLKPGARVITISKTISSPEFVLRGSGTFRMGWGDATAYVYEKLPTS